MLRGASLECAGEPYVSNMIIAIISELSNPGAPPPASAVMPSQPPPARPGHTWPDTLRVSLSCIGKLGSSAAFSLVYLYRFCAVSACYSSLLYC